MHSVTQAILIAVFGLLISIRISVCIARAVAKKVVHETMKGADKP